MLDLNYSLRVTDTIYNNLNSMNEQRASRWDLETQVSSIVDCHSTLLFSDNKYNINLTDTLRERDALTEVVYPRLRDYCRENYGLEFQVGIGSLVMKLYLIENSHAHAHTHTHTHTEREREREREERWLGCKDQTHFNQFSLYGYSLQCDLYLILCWLLFLGC